ncbi:MAG: alpha/beta hydrolase [Rhodospirillales bacterium]|nr:alpha/beta hydrolase [Rhodospirillales bacterium]
MGALERTTCGWFRERVAFFGWRAMARSVPVAPFLNKARFDTVTFTTKDGRELVGYRVRPQGSDGDRARGYVLLAQGNAMLAGHGLDFLGKLTSVDLDGYVFDYRGYGRSGGKSRLAAMLSDYQELIGHLNGLGYQHAVLYGMSMGGIIMANAIGAGVRYDLAVLDSPPSRVRTFGCPAAFDPIENLPQDASRIMIVRGDRDRVVWPSWSKALADTAQNRGGTVHFRDDFGHPMMDGRDRERAALFHAFLARGREIP